MNAANGPTGERLRGLVERLAPGLWSDPRRARQRQFVVMGVLAAALFAALWLIFSVAENRSKSGAANQAIASAGPDAASVTNIGVMAPGEPVSPEDSWVGNAGRKLAQYESDKEEQSRINRDAKDFEAGTMKRFSELEQRLTANAAAQANGQAVAVATPPGATVGVAAVPAAGLAIASPSGGMTAGVGRPELSSSSAMPPERGLPPPPGAGPAKWPTAGSNVGMQPGLPVGRPMAAMDFAADSAAVPMTRVSLASPTSQATSGTSDGSTVVPVPGSGRKGLHEGFLPVSFTRGTLLGGLDAPTGGQAQSNPQPVLIRLSDTSVLPNQYRADFQECFVIASGYGDISTERAYMRTGVLSCVREDGQALEVEIEGNVFGEDGKYGVRGKLVSKQGQMLANALLAGVVSGIGQGFANANTTYSTSALGSTATTSGSQAYRAGVGTGVGKALDRLAQYYIKLAEQTFPVIEVDAGREIDVVITKGVRIETGTAPFVASANSTDQPTAASSNYFKVQDEDY